MCIAIFFVSTCSFEFNRTSTVCRFIIFILLMQAHGWPWLSKALCLRIYCWLYSDHADQFKYVVVYALSDVYWQSYASLTEGVRMAPNRPLKPSKIVSHYHYRYLLQRYLFVSLLLNSDNPVVTMSECTSKEFIGMGLWKNRVLLLC